jgi:hypothetical protein
MRWTNDPIAFLTVEAIGELSWLGLGLHVRLQVSKTSLGRSSAINPNVVDTGATVYTGMKNKQAKK